MAVEVAKQLSDLSGREVPRTQVDQWLNPDVDHMSEPFWGNGEMLCQAIALARLAMDARDAAKEMAQLREKAEQYAREKAASEAQAVEDKRKASIIGGAQWGALEGLKL